MALRLLLMCCLLLTGCMKPTDLYDHNVYYLRDVGILEHFKTQRRANWVLQPSSFIYIAQGHFVPVGHPYARPNVVAEEAFKGFVEYFPQVRRARNPLGLDEALQEAKGFGAHYLLYGRFASAEENIGNWEEWEEREEFTRIGRDHAILHLMLIETSTGYLVDTARIKSRGGFLTFYDKDAEDLLRRPLTDYARRLLGFAED